MLTTASNQGKLRLAIPSTSIDRPPGYETEAATSVATAPGDGRVVDRWAVLAGVRFFLVLTVIGFHLQFVVDLSSLWWKPVATYSAFGSVVAFFFISGYSISHSYTRQQAGFYRRRFWRIYPTYLACLLLCLIPYALAKGGFVCLNGVSVDKAPVTDWLSAAVFGQGFWLKGAFVHNTAWSLAAGVCFYILTPLLALFRSRMLLGVALLSGLAFSACRILGLHPAAVAIYGFPAFAYAWVWLLGFVYYRHENSTWAKALLVVTVPALAPGVSTSLLAGAMLFGKSIRVTPGLSRLLKYLGDLSYPLFLAHFPVFFTLYVKYHFESAWIYMLACMLCAMLLHHLIEQPIAYLRKHRGGFDLHKGTRAALQN